MRKRRAADAQLVAVLAGRGQGKSAWLSQWLAANPCPRRAVWDFKGEHTAGRRHTSDLPTFIGWMKADAWDIVFIPERLDADKRAGEFDLWCQAVYVAGRCQAIVEELAFVTSPSRAPAGWRQLLLVGRDLDHQGRGQVTVVCTAQRPASVDKDLLGNVTLLHAGRLPFEDDARLVGRALGVPFTELQTLPKLHWVERGEHDTEPRRGVLNFSAAPTPARSASGKRPKAGNSTPPP